MPVEQELKFRAGMQVCGKQQLVDESLIVNKQNRGIRDVVLWAYKPNRVHPGFAKQNNQPVVVDNKNCRFEPHVVLVSTSRKLQVTNTDNFAHNYFAQFFKNNSVNPLVTPHAAVDFKFTSAESVPIVAKCSIHSWMNGVVLVQDHPYMASSDEDGKFELRNLPSGDLTICVWHQKMGWIKEVLIDNKKANWKRGRYRIKLEDNEDHTFVVDPKLFAKK